MLPRETITFNGMENGPEFEDANEEYFNYKFQQNHYITKDGNNLPILLSRMQV